MPPTVTIDRAYFEGLLRQAYLDADGIDWSTPVDLPTVTIPKVDHDNLLRVTDEYIKLRKALTNAGIAPQTIQVLLDGQESSPGPASVLGSRKLNPQSFSEGGSGGSFRQSSSKPSKPVHSAWAVSTTDTQGTSDRASRANRSNAQREMEGTGAYLADRDHSEFEYDDEDIYGLPDDSPQRPPHFFGNNHDRRSLVLSNLRSSTTHKEVIAAIRGGQLLDMYFRPGRDFAANIAFVEGSAAKAFFEHVKRDDLYINGRRIEVTWNDRQFVLQGHIANRVANNGATRNLCIAHISSHITAEKIRDDLEHIHNLTVVDLTFDAGSAYVSLNSIHAAATAKQCLGSRLEYKGATRIRYYEDECTQPLPAPTYRFNSAHRVPVEKPSLAALNRFDALKLGSDGESDGESDATATTLGGGGVVLT